MKKKIGCVENKLVIDGLCKFNMKDKELFEQEKKTLCVQFKNLEKTSKTSNMMVTSQIKRHVFLVQA